MDIAIIASLLFVIWRIISIAASVSGGFRRVWKMVSSGLAGRLRQRDAYHGKPTELSDRQLDHVVGGTKKIDKAILSLFVQCASGEQRLPHSLANERVAEKTDANTLDCELGHKP
jgi:hypothetical protein